MLDQVILAANGYVGIYEDGGGAPGRLLGSSGLLETGTHDDVAVELSEQSASATSVFAIVHVEDTGNKTLDFPTGDVPVDGESGVVLVRIPLKK